SRARFRRPQPARHSPPSTHARPPTTPLFPYPTLFRSPEELIEALEKFVDNYNNRRYHESLNNLTPADIYYGRSEQIIEKRKRIKADSIQRRRKLYNHQKLINL